MVVLALRPFNVNNSFGIASTRVDLTCLVFGTLLSSSHIATSIR